MVSVHGMLFDVDTQLADSEHREQRECMSTRVSSARNRARSSA